MQQTRLKYVEVVNTSDKARPLRDLRFPGGMLVMEPWVPQTLHHDLFHKFCGNHWLSRLDRAKRMFPERYIEPEPETTAEIEVIEVPPVEIEPLPEAPKVRRRKRKAAKSAVKETSK